MNDAPRIDAVEAERERIIKLLWDFDDWQWCNCSHYNCDTNHFLRRHMLNIPESLEKLTATIRGGTQ